MKYILETIKVGPVETNSYILGCAMTRDAVIIDPGADDEGIKKRLKENRLSVAFIINTHGHSDHIGANGKFAVPVLIHKLDKVFLNDSAKNLSFMTGISVSSPQSSRSLEDKEILKLGDLTLEVLHTPGHTPGSISIKCEDLVFTGDALFKEGIGRADLPYSSEEELFKSIRERLFVLPDSTKVYPGHGPSTTIGYEKVNNPFFR